LHENEGGYASGSKSEAKSEYNELKQKFQKSGRYGDRAAQVAEHIVNK
jgi:hypothetical protein